MQESDILTNSDNPKHIGLILDGNRRWASANGLPSLEGHKRGYENLKTIAEAAFDRGVDFVSAYVFSTENWNRSKEEVGYLMNLVVSIVNKELDDLISENVRVVFLGSKDRLSDKVISAIEKAEKKSKNNTGGTLALCLNYGGRQEIIDAVKSMSKRGEDLTDLTEDMMQQNLYSSDIPELDFIIRTSGEMRISNFMLWRAAYAELYFVDVHWPAFSIEDLDKSFEVYRNRHRRFGK